ncbi:MAG: GtrA family protein [Kiritimatiellae bacterium]|nr:GtrA family protein [Kiritimatiellia bacterium]
MLNIIKHLVARYRQLIVYCIIGCTGATLDFVVYALLTNCVGIHYQFANFLSVSFGIVNNFFWNCYFNFKTKDKILKRLASFYSVGMFGWALSAVCLWLFIEVVELNDLIAKLGTIFFVTVVQFCLNKFITFRK